MEKVRENARRPADLAACKVEAKEPGQLIEQSDLRAAAP
jgi:hypothetical protein